MEVTDGMVKGILIFALIIAIGTIGIFVGGPILALYILIKGWNDSHPLIILVAFLIPFVFVGIIFINPNNDDWGQLETLWAIISPIITYAMLFIAYGRKDQMFNV